MIFVQLFGATFMITLILSFDWSQIQIVLAKD